MVYVVAAVVATAVLCVFNLVLTLGLIRRQRLPDASSGPSLPGGDLVVGAGRRVGAFQAQTLDGEPVSDDALAAGTVVGFFAPGCGPCAELLPAFVDRVSRIPGGRDAALAVLSGSGDGFDAYVAALTGVSRVVVEPADGPVATAFQVRSFPAFAVLDDRQRVRSSGVTAGVFAAPAATR
ncbi:TlpA family protein disulfide reductase [Couchioplanes azureus]|uniref:TlpA family protein disulfide reductase n=1 Tax=Couchioplanes caeruleus TaxID=56438 RepID=UPI00166F9F1B|nr:hypothetical protein [Couchioplanes caeruleus]GGQ75158.1 hypothetical protein GCM10010166_51370 [Couchioplanes caeruleus subsp. azureus]